MNHTINILSGELGLPVVLTKIGEGIFESKQSTTKFFIPKEVNRAGTLRIDGYLGITSDSPDVFVDKTILDLREYWSLNIINLPWIIPHLYIRNIEYTNGMRELSQYIREALDLLPEESHVRTLKSDPLKVTDWRMDRQDWIVNKLQFNMR